MKTIIVLLCLFVTAAGARAEQMVALTNDNRLFFFDHTTPGTIVRTAVITGLQSGETLFGIDFRPATGQLYALGSTSRLYQVDVNSGAATAVGSAGAFSIVGANFGFDFNPVVDRVRITSDSDQNIRVNPNDGTATSDVTLRFAAGDPNNGVNAAVVASAYTNNFAGAGATVLYDIDQFLDALVIQDPPNSGALRTIGPLGIDTGENTGFDISGVTGRAYASLTVGGPASPVPSLYTIDLVTGTATLIGEIAPGMRGSAAITDIAAFTSTKFRNLSTRGRVGTGDDVLIGGFISRGAASTTVVFRAIGPSLSSAGVSGVLADPVLTVHDSSGAILETNDNWHDSPQAAQIMAAGLAPTDDNESAVLLTLPPGTYTAIVSGAGGTTGVALVEAYEL